MDSILFFKKSFLFLFKEEKLRAFEDKLLLNNSRMKNLAGYFKWCIIEGLFLMIIGMSCGATLLMLEPEKFVLLGGAFFFAPFAVNYILQDLIFERRKRFKEGLLPDVLLEASVFCDETSLLNTIKRLAESDFPLLREDFHRAAIEINNGSSADEALQRIKELNKSKAFDRALDLMLQGYKSGAHMSSNFKEAAEDLMETQAILRERQAVMLVTKYTLLLSAGIIVPAVLGLITGLVSGLNFNAMGELSLGLSAEQRKELFDFAVLGTSIYVVEYALLSSFFLALQEGNKKQFFVYCAIIVPAALAAFTLAKVFG